MKGNLLAAVFAALFTTSTYAHPRVSDGIQFKVSIDVAEVTEDPTTYAVLFFEGAKLCPSGDFYTLKKPVNCSEFIIDEPEIEVKSVTLHGFANCTVYTDSDKAYDLVNFGLSSVIDTVDPYAIFVRGKCCYPKEG